MTECFGYLDMSHVSLVRITIKIMDIDEDPCTVNSKFRKDLYQFLKLNIPDAVLRGTAEIAINHANARYSTYPNDAVGEKIRASGFANMPAHNLHLHGILYHPNLNVGQVANLFHSFIPGTDRFWIGKPKAQSTDEDGNELGGAVGWGEYSGLEIKEITPFVPPGYSGGRVDIAAFQAHDLDNYSLVRNLLPQYKKFSRSKRNYKFNDRWVDISRISKIPLSSLPYKGSNRFSKGEPSKYSDEEFDEYNDDDINYYMHEVEGEELDWPCLDSDNDSIDDYHQDYFDYCSDEVEDEAFDQYHGDDILYYSHQVEGDGTDGWSFHAGDGVEDHHQHAHEYSYDEDDQLTSVWTICGPDDYAKATRERLYPTGFPYIKRSPIRKIKNPRKSMSGVRKSFDFFSRPGLEKPP